MIPFDKREGYLWYNGKFVPWQDAKVHILNHGLNYASCIFEGERVYNGKIFKSEEHTERLFNSAKLLDFEIPYSYQTIMSAKEEFLKKQSLSNAYLKVFAWRGCETMKIGARETLIHVAVTGWELPQDYNIAPKQNGVRVCISKWQRPPSSSFPSQSKASGAYVISTLAKHEAKDAGFEDAILLDWRGYVAEGSSSNIFCVIDGQLLTPISDCFLNGITRQTVMDLATQAGIIIKEVRLSEQDLYAASELFFTGTSSEITPIVQVNDTKYKIGKITKSLIESYEKLANS